MRLPVWIRNKQRHSELRDVKSILRGHGVYTVCEEARCPNKARCFSKPTATFLILGDRCTRGCGFCSVESATPKPPDEEEPRKVAQAAGHMGLKYVVITSVTRDDLDDGGAGQFAQTILEVRRELPGAKVEVLTPDFRGSHEAIMKVLEARPDVFNHNVETVPRLYPEVRPKADYVRSLTVLRRAGEISPGVPVKSGLMLGLGEDFQEVVEVLSDLREAGCEMVTIGQYLRPGRKNLPVSQYVSPDAFARLGDLARQMGFRRVASSPLARSSMNAEEMYEIEQGVGNV